MIFSAAYEDRLLIFSVKITLLQSNQYTTNLIRQSVCLSVCLSVCRPNREDNKASENHFLILFWALNSELFKSECQYLHPWFFVPCYLWMLSSLFFHHNVSSMALKKNPINIRWIRTGSRSYWKIIVLMTIGTNIKIK